MDKEDKKKFAQEFSREINEAVLSSAKDSKFPLWRRSHWDEWGSPVGLSLGWALFVIPLGLFIYFLHLAGLIG
jgi:hypothetical protein